MLLRQPYIYPGVWLSSHALVAKIAASMIFHEVRIAEPCAASPLQVQAESETPQQFC